MYKKTNGRPERKRGKEEQKREMEGIEVIKSGKVKWSENRDTGKEVENMNIYFRCKMSGNNSKKMLLQDLCDR